MHSSAQIPAKAFRGLNLLVATLWIQAAVANEGGCSCGQGRAPEHKAYDPAYSLQTSKVVIDAKAPDFSGTAVVNGTIGRLQSTDYRGKWVVLFFYPKDFTFVCPTEIIAFNDQHEEFQKRNAEVIGASCDSAEVHLAWLNTPRNKGGLGPMTIPLIADVDRKIAGAYGALNEDNVPNRAVYVISPEGKLKSMQINMNDVGRSVEEIKRLVDAYEFVSKHDVVCPANWRPGDKTMVPDPIKAQDYFKNVV